MAFGAGGRPGGFEVEHRHRGAAVEGCRGHGVADARRASGHQDPKAHEVVSAHRPHVRPAGPSGKRYSAMESSRSRAPPPGAGWSAVPPAAHDDGVGEVLVEMVDVLDPSVVGRATHGDEVEHRQVLNHLAQADASRVRAHGHAELGGEQEDGEVLVDATDPAGVDLHDIDRLGLEHLLEDDPVLDVLTRRDPYRVHRSTDGEVAEHVVR